MLPVFASSARRCASSVTMKSLSPSIAKPRFTSPQHAVRSRRQLAAIAPDLAARLRIDRPRHVLRSGDVEHVVADERRRLEVAERARLERPLRLQAVHVLGVDLRERTVAMVAVVAAEGEPLRSVGRQAREDLLVRDERRRRGRLLRRQRHGRNRAKDEQHRDLYESCFHVHPRYFTAVSKPFNV